MNSNTVVTVDQVSRSFRVKAIAKGKPLHRRLFSSSRRELIAVRDLSLTIERGERVALLGPNGAGKSTMMRMLTGLLEPSSGRIEVAGLIPSVQRRALSMRIGCVFGQISNLWPHLSVRENFLLFQKMYRVSEQDLQERLKALSEVFGLGALLDRRPAALSLGERMKCEIASSLLHGPELLFLDEPSIGLDVIARLKLREMIRTYGETSGSTVLLTSHDTGDVEGVCSRIIVINHGGVVFDGTIVELRRRYLKNRIVSVRCEHEALHFDDRRLEVATVSENVFSISFDPLEIRTEEVVGKVLARGGILDISIAEVDLEQVLARMYQEVA